MSKLTKRQELIAMMFQAFVIKYGENDNRDWWIKQSIQYADLILRLTEDKK